MQVAESRGGHWASLQIFDGRYQPAVAWVGGDASSAHLSTSGVVLGEYHNERCEKFSRDGPSHEGGEVHAERERGLTIGVDVVDELADLL